MSSRIRVDDHIPYESFVPTFTAPSTLPSGGDGLFAVDALPPFTWLGFYPGKCSKRFNGKRQDHTMGTVDDAFIIADAAIKEGMHMINEAGRCQVANVWYVKLDSGYVLYFVGRPVQPNEELLTCYSRRYGKRSYPIPTKCSDPRCVASGKHRVESAMLDEWRPLLLEQVPASLGTLATNYLGVGSSACVPAAAPTESTMGSTLVGSDTQAAQPSSEVSWPDTPVGTSE